MIIENNQIEIKTIPSTEYVLEGIINKIYVMLDIVVNKVKGEEDEIRTPLELSLVLDRSGSMGGDRLRNAKKAVRMIVENLSSEDRVHLVVYDDKVDLIFKDGDLSNKNHLLDQIDRIQPRGMTNLGGGIIEGQKLIHRDTTKSKRLWLFSDGLANVGPKTISEIKPIITDILENGINTTSFGIGNGFNEDLMMNIAEHGNGDFYYIETADTIPKVVEEGLNGLLNVVTSNTVLKVRGMDGVTVTKIFNYEITGAILGDLRDGETRKILVELEINPGKLIDTGEILKYELTYNPISNLMKSTSHRSNMMIQKTTDESKILDENQEVLELKKILEMTELEDKTVSMIDNGEFDGALKLQNVIVTQLKAMPLSDAVAEKLDRAKIILSKIKDGKERGDMRESRKYATSSSYMSRRSKKRQKYN